ncbi:MAG: hypothetical protein AAFY74_12085 [Pseudomonadota bacterium]
MKLLNTSTRDDQVGSVLKIKEGLVSYVAYNPRATLLDVEERHTFVVLFDNEARILARVSGLFSGFASTKMAWPWPK